jgi:PAS domain S-box-containing protein
MDANSRKENNDDLKREIEEDEQTGPDLRRAGEGGLPVEVGPDEAGRSPEGVDKMFRVLFEGMAEGAILVTPEGTILYSNPSMSRSLGVSREEFNGRNIKGLVEHDSRHQLEACFSGKVRTPSDLEIHFLAHDGSTVPMQVSIIGSEGTGREVLLLTATGPIESKRLEADLGQVQEMVEVGVEERTRELQASQELMKTILMQMPAGVAVVDREGSLVLVNGEMDRILAEFPDEDGAQAVDGRDQPASWERITAVFNNMIGSVRCIESNRRSELDFERPNGTPGHLSIRSAPVRDDEGMVEACVHLVLDVSDTIELQRELQTLAVNLRRSNEELQQFVSVASHDLKEPLRMVSSYVGLIKRRYEGKLDEEADEFIGYAVDGAKRMEFLIDDLLRYTRVDTKTEPFRHVDMMEVMEGVLKDLEAPIGAAGAIVICEDLPVISCDRSQMNQLLENLISNAIKFRGTSLPRVEISGREEGSYHLFWVKDNGVGIPEGCGERIFKMFQRAHKGMGYEGTGIGLAICKKIVERHGGKIWVESDGHSGSTFFFTIPLDPEPSCFKMMADR